MDLKNYKYLLMIEKYNNLTQAAHHLYISPSALSKYLTNLESELNLPLFIKSGYTFIPSEYGQEVLTSLHEIANIEEKLDIKLNKMSSKYNHAFKVGFQTSLDNSLLQTIFLSFLKKHSDLEFTFWQDHQKELVAKVKNHKLDCAIVLIDEEVKELHQDLLADSEFIITARKEFHLPYWDKSRKYPWLAFNDIKKLQIATVPAGQRIRKYVDDYFKSNGDILQPKVQVSTSNLALDITCKSDFITFVPEIFINIPAYKNLAGYSFGSKPIINKLCLIRRNDNSDERIDSFRDSIAEIL